ncbi:MAG: PAS domain-containing sensor histidine kinase [Actinomycetota bacterium]|nr:PAS domain-containing sensor histidine kinase [Actinomycetota bacterium]
MGAGQYDDLPDAVVIADREGLVCEVNDAAVRLLGRRRADLDGVALSKVLALRDVEGQDWWHCVRPYDGIATRSRLVESSWYLADGTEVLLTVRLHREQATGPVTRLAAVLRDARTRQRMDRSRSDLVATVAHELRSPLTGVKGFTSTLLSKWERFSDSQRRLMLETVDADADRLTRLIAELLDVARIDSRRLQLRTQPLDLAQRTRQLVGNLPAGDGRPRRLRLHQVPETWVDPDKYAQVLSNLMENAVRHGEGTITVGVQPGDGVVELWVQDEGHGIPAELRQRVFTKFWRHGSHTGTGLGLYIVHGLVAAHGGSVTVEAATGGGARLRVCLPSGQPAVME